jgi:anti-anti-sigma factor
MTTLTRREDVCVLAVAGDLTKATVKQFDTLVSQCLTEDAHDFVVDLAACNRVDSAGLEALTRLNRACRERLGMAKLCLLPENLKKIMEITRLEKKLDISATLDEAIAALKQ